MQADAHNQRIAQRAKRHRSQVPTASSQYTCTVNDLGPPPTVRMEAPIKSRESLSAPPRWDPTTRISQRRGAGAIVATQQAKIASGGVGERGVGRKLYNPMPTAYAI